MASSVPPTTPTGSHTWSVEHKQILCALSRFFKVTGTSDNTCALVNGAERILCHIFAQEQARAGASPWITYPALRRMLYELQRKGHRAWLSVFIDTEFADTTGRWANVRDRLMKAAVGQGIRLSLRKKDHIIAAKQIGVLKKQAKATSYTVRQQRLAIRTTPERPQPTPTMLIPQTVPELSSEDELPTGISVDDFDDYTYAPRVVGRLAFRVFTPSSHSINGEDGCFAGAFTGCATIPPKRSSKQFMDGAYVHLRPLQQASPFLSITTSLLVALRLALWKGMTGSAKIAIIKMDAIATPMEEPGRLTPSKAIINRLAHFKGVLQHTRDDQTGSRTESTPERQRAYNYNCITEWVVWGRIPGDAIISIVNVDELLDFLKGNPAIDESLHVSTLGDVPSAFKAGDFLRSLKIRKTRRVGQCVSAFLKFLGLDIEKTLRLATTMQSAWGIGKHAKTKAAMRTHSPTNNEAAYFRGVLEGFVNGAPKPKQALDPAALGLHQTVSNVGQIDLGTGSDIDAKEIIDIDTESGDDSPCPIRLRTYDLVDLVKEEEKDEDEEMWDLLSEQEIAEAVSMKPSKPMSGVKALSLSSFRLGRG